MERGASEAERLPDGGGTEARFEGIDGRVSVEYQPERFDRLSVGHEHLGTCSAEVGCAPVGLSVSRVGAGGL